MMGRIRKARKDLPERVYFKHGSYYFVDKQNKWINLGKDYHQAMINLAEINTTPLMASTMARIMDRYQQDIIPKKSPRTQQDNLREIRLLRAVFGHMKPADITPQDVYGYMDRRPPVRANREKSLLSHIFSMAIRWGAASDNPCALVKANKETPRDRYITDAEFWAVYEIASPMVKVAMLLAWMTGLRQNRILALKRQNLTETGIEIDSGKGGKKLIIEWTPELRAAVRDATQLRTDITSIHLICTRDGQKYSSSGFKSIWQRTMNLAVQGDGKDRKPVINERFTFHDLRAKSGSDHATGEHLGHQNAKTLSRVYRRKPVTVSPVNIGSK